MTYELTPAEQRAILRTLNPDQTLPSPDPVAALASSRDAVHAPAARGTGSCAACEGCRYVSAAEGRASEPWHRYLVRAANVPRHRRPPWRPCPSCNAAGRLPYRDPASGVEDGAARAPRQRTRRPRSHGQRGR